MEDQYLKLMFVTNKGSELLENYLEFISTCIQNGVTSVQFREPKLFGKDLFEYGRSLKAILDLNNIPLIVNNNIELCLRLDAKGLHLGQTDENAIIARRILGPKKIIGLTANNISQIEIANDLPINYIGIGAVYQTKNYNTPSNWNIATIKQAAAISKYPLIAIGGINENNAHSLIQAGVTGIAAIGAFHESLDIKLTTKVLKSIVNKKDYCND